MLLARETWWSCGTGGPGWHFQKHDKTAIDFRVTLLLDLFRRRRNHVLPALTDIVQPVLSALSDHGPNMQGEDPVIGVGSEL